MTTPHPTLSPGGEGGVRGIRGIRHHSRHSKKGSILNEI